MGVRDYIRTGANGPSIHHECRRCGRNMDEETDSCPECGGQVAVYEL